MDLQAYEKFVESSWVGSVTTNDRHLRDLYICTAGIAGETGEVCEKLKKFVRDGTILDDSFVKELGDVLFYLTTIGRLFGISLEDIMQTNYEKLTARQAKGTMRGSGDNR